MIIQSYSSLLDIFDDLKLKGINEVDTLLRDIRAASDMVDRIGHFVPVTESRIFDGSGSDVLWVDPIVAITSIVVDGVTLTGTDYLVEPVNRYKPNGAYTRLIVNPDSSQISVWPRERQIITITGRWGLYEESRDTGAAIASGADQSNVQTTLTVTNGARLSPGVIALIGTEQEFIEAYRAPISAGTTLTADAAATAETITVADGTKVSIGEVIKIDFEQLRIVDIAANVLLVRRAWGGTSAAAHSSGATVYALRAFDVLRGVNGTTAAAHAAGAALARYFAPRDIGMLAAQIAGLIWRKHNSGWAGKVGNVALGEVFYLDEFPKDVFNRVAAEWRTVGEYG